MARPSLNAYLTLMRFDKPIGIWLLFFPAAWGVLLAGIHVSWNLLFVMFIGACVTRAAGCIINDLTDRTLDVKVARTRARPLAAGTVPVGDAFLLLAMLFACALYIALLLPAPALLVAILAVPMIAAYPWMKLITWWPQAFLGLTFNLGTIIGWFATDTPLTLPTITLYLACVFWTLAYDTIYALQDMGDDAVVGIKSTARRLGDNVPRFVTGCFIFMVGLLLLSGFLCGAGLFFLGGLLGAAIHMHWQVRQLHSKQTPPGKLFVSNQWLGLVLTLALIADRLTAS